MKDLKFAETCKYVTMTDTVIYPFAVVMNMERWKALPPDVQKVMDDLALEQAEWTGQYMDGHVKEAMDWSVQTHNVEVIKLDAATQAEWNNRLQFITDQWVKDTNAKDFPAQAIVDDIQSLTVKHAP
jgi:TRAP-type C4-dicarboxylate transport system substrate-binding protein